MNALYRPGPMDYIPDFIDRKHGRKPIEYDIPIMEKYLKGELSPESEAKAAEIQNRRIDYGIHERQYMEISGLDDYLHLSDAGYLWMVQRMWSQL